MKLMFLDVWRANFNARCDEEEWVEVPEPSEWEDDVRKRQSGANESLPRRDHISVRGRDLLDACPSDPLSSSCRPLLESTSRSLHPQRFQFDVPC